MANTLAIDIGGTGIKALVLGPTGEVVKDRVRLETPRPATPEAVLATITTLVAQLGAFDRISVGFPGVVIDGVTMTAPNLHESWHGVPLAAQANAGQPEMKEGEIAYRADPDEFARQAVAMVESGARLIGGCCGTTPEFIARIAAALAAAGLR